MMSCTLDGGGGADALAPRPEAEEKATAIVGNDTTSGGTDHEHAQATDEAASTTVCVVSSEDQRADESSSQGQPGDGGAAGAGGFPDLTKITDKRQRRAEREKILSSVMRKQNISRKEALEFVQHGGILFFAQGGARVRPARRHTVAVDSSSISTIHENLIMCSGPWSCCSSRRVESSVTILSGGAVGLVPTLDRSYHSLRP